MSYLSQLNLCQADCQFRDPYRLSCSWAGRFCEVCRLDWSIWRSGIFFVSCSIDWSILVRLWISSVTSLEWYFHYTSSNRLLAYAQKSSHCPLSLCNSYGAQKMMIRLWSLEKSYRGADNQYSSQASRKVCQILGNRAWDFTDYFQSKMTLSQAYLRLGLIGLISSLWRLEGVWKILIPWTPHLFDCSIEGSSGGLEVQMCIIYNYQLSNILFRLFSSHLSKS